MFVTFLYIFVAPSLESRESRASKINGLQSQILENVTQTMTVRGVKVNYEGNLPRGRRCFRLTDFFTFIPIPDKKVIIQTTYEPTLDAYFDESDPTDLILFIPKWMDANERLISKEAFVKVYNSSLLPKMESSPSSDNGQCLPVPFETGYFVGYTREEKLVMASAIQSLISHYQTDEGYDQLKRIFNVGGDFGFNFTYQDGTNIGTTRYVPQSAEVYSQEYPLVYAANNRGLEVGTLSVRIW